MRMYPQYKAADVLAEYAVTFFTLLNAGYRLENKRYMMMAQIASVPHMEDSARTGFLRQLEWSSKDPSDILETDEGPADMNGVKNLFRSI